MKNKDMFILVLSIKDDLFDIVTKINNPHDGWEALEMMFEARNPTKKLHLSNTLHIIKMEEGSQMIEFFKSIKELKTQLVVVGEKVEDVVLIQIMLNALSLSYGGIIQTITT
jgi:hypothetical protein